MPRPDGRDGFVFALKGPCYATNRMVLAGAGESIERFFGSEVLELKDKLGPINWQLAATKTFDPDDFDAFLALLPKRVEGRAMRHAVEVRHQSICAPEFLALAREHGVAVVVAGDSEYPLLPDPTAPFVYLHAMGSSDGEANGYSAAALDAWSGRIEARRNETDISPTTWRLLAMGRPGTAAATSSSTSSVATGCAILQPRWP